VSGVTEDELAELMVGRAVNLKLPKKPQQPGNIALKIENLTVLGPKGTPAVNKLNLELHQGEILGIAGVDGNGQTELAGAIAGLLPVHDGHIWLKDVDISRMAIKKRIEHGLGMVPEDRHKHGLVLDFRVDENLILKSYKNQRFANKTGFLKFTEIKAHANELIEQFDIRAGRGPATLARSMSGGNQQKVVIAREVDLSPEVLVVAQPTRGLDVGAIEYIHRRILEERDKGRAVLLISFELDEIMGLCDRIAAISKGSIVGIVEAETATERQIGALMGGVHQ
jgi:simple sugar transport system ATP-binding protein